MAQSLNLSAIVEGVKMEEQRQFLLDNVCTCNQGYLFGKPVPIVFSMIIDDYAPHNFRLRGYIV